MSDITHRLDDVDQHNGCWIGVFLSKLLQSVEKTTSLSDNTFIMYTNKVLTITPVKDD